MQNLLKKTNDGKHQKLAQELKSKLQGLQRLDLLVQLSEEEATLLL
jgi:hypothetical protein